MTITLEPDEQQYNRTDNYCSHDNFCNDNYDYINVTTNVAIWSRI